VSHLHRSEGATPIVAFCGGREPVNVAGDRARQEATVASTRKLRGARAAGLVWGLTHPHRELVERIRVGGRPSAPPRESPPRRCFGRMPRRIRKSSWQPTRRSRRGDGRSTRERAFARSAAAVHPEVRRRLRARLPSGRL